jgi:hypothetical protein
MLKHLAAVVLLLVPAIGCKMWSKPPSGWIGATGGEHLEHLFWQDVQAKNWAEVDRHIASTFAGAGAGGTLDREAFLRDLQKAPLTDFSLSECRSQLNGADVIIACTLRAQWAGQLSTGSTLSVWQQLKKGWLMVAHSESRLAAGCAKAAPPPAL